MPIDQFDTFSQREERSDLAIADLIARDQAEPPPTPETREPHAQVWEWIRGQMPKRQKSTESEPEDERRFTEAEGPHGEFVEVEVVSEGETAYSETDASETDDPSVLEGELASDSESPSEQQARKRRRRRRGGRRGNRSREGREETENRAGDERGDRDDEESASPDEELSESLDVEGGAESTEEIAGETKEQADDRKRSRRRRRRRGKKRDGDDSPKSEQSDADPPRAKFEDDDDDDSEIVDEDHRGPGPDDIRDFEESDSDDHLGGDKNSHRGIPSWDEAVGIMIATNMEARAKAPQERPQRGRPRRGRGQGGRSGDRR